MSAEIPHPPNEATSTPSGPPEPVSKGQRVGDRYVIQELIGSGGMGMVYRAIEDEIEREVALKFILVHDTMPDEEREAYYARFRQEAQALGGLPPHPNRVVLYQYGQEAQLHYMAMEMVRGESLYEVMNRGLSADQVMAYTRQLAMALEDVHASGIIHRDLKPENLIVTRSLLGDEQLKLIDFGIARSPVRVEDTTQSEEQEILGTVLYMAPELLLDGIQDARTDIYAIGIILFELVTGKTPFDHILETEEGDPNDVMEIMHHHINTPPGPMTPRRSVGELPEAFEAVVLRCLAKDPEARFADASELLRTIKEVARANRGTGLQKLMSREEAAAVLAESGDELRADIQLVPSKDIGATVIATAICPQQKLVAAADAAGDARIWNYETGTEVQYLPAPDGRLPTRAVRSRLAFAPDGRLLAHGDCVGQLWLLDVEHNTRERLQLSRGGPLALAFDQATTLMVVATTAGTLELWNVPDRKQLAVLVVDLPKAPANEPQWSLKSLALSPHRLFLAAGTDTGMVYIWNFKDRDRTGPLNPPPPVPGEEVAPRSPVVYLAFSNDDAHLAVLRGASVVELWDPSRMVLLRRIALPEPTAPSRLAFSPDGVRLLVTYNSGAIVTVDVEAGEVLETIRIPRGTAANLAFTPDDVPMASLGSGSSVQVWDLLRLGRVRTLGSFPTRLVDVTLAPRGDTVLTLASGGRIDRWDMVTGRHLGRQIVEARTLRELHKAPDFGRALACGPRDGLVAFEGIDFNSHSPLRRVELPVPELVGNERLVTYAISADSRLVALGYISGEVRVYGYREVSEPTVFPGTGRAISTVAFSPDGQTIAVADEGGCVRLLDVVTGQVEWEEHSVRFPVRMVAFAPSGRLLSIPRNNVIEIWNLARKRRVARLRGHDGQILTLVHGLEGRLLLSASKDGTARLWDVAQQRVLRVLDDHPGPVTAATFDPELRFLLTTSGPYLSMWRIADAELLARFAYCGEEKIKDSDPRHHWIAYTPDGRYTASTPSPPSVLMTRAGSRVRLSDEEREALFDPRTVALRLLSA